MYVSIETVRMHRRDKDNMKKMSIFLWTSETGIQKRKQCWQGEWDHSREGRILILLHTASMGNKLLINRFYYERKQRCELKELWKTTEKPETKKLQLLQISEIGSFIEIKTSLPKGRIWKQCHTQGECSRVFWSVF